MNKEDILLKNYSILAKNPMKNYEAIKSIISQLCEENPKLAIRCWLDILQSNIQELEIYFNKIEIDYNSFADKFVRDLENDLLSDGRFKYAVDEYAKNKQLLEIIYTQLPIYEYTSAYYAISFLIRNKKLQLANNILTAIYKNKMFNNYSKLWKNIIGRFEYYPDNYDGGGFVSDDNYKQGKKVQEFCMSWAERIVDEEEQAGAITHIMRIF